MMAPMSKPPESAAADPSPVPQPQSAEAEGLLAELLARRKQLLAEISELEQRRDRLQRDIRGHFAGSSDELSRRVKGFQDYLVGALQELSQRAEALELTPQEVIVQPSPMDQQQPAPRPPQQPDQTAPAAPSPQITSPFAADQTLIAQMIARFQHTPDFYGPAWQLRCSLDDLQGEILGDWCFNQAGRGAQQSLGRRHRNLQVGAAAIALLTEIYGEQLQTLVLAGQPERLGDWRRGLQDHLGLGREDFGPNSGISLFERPDALIQRADRLEALDGVPFILIDAAEQVVDIPILQFPIWLAFAADDRELAMDLEPTV